MQFGGFYSTGVRIIAPLKQNSKNVPYKNGLLAWKEFMRLL